MGASPPAFVGRPGFVFCHVVLSLQPERCVQIREASDRRTNRVGGCAVASRLIGRVAEGPRAQAMTYRCGIDRTSRGDRMRGRRRTATADVLQLSVVLRADRAPGMKVSG